LYRKFSADHIFNGYVFLEQEVLITDAAGVIIDLVAEQDAGENIEKLDGILCPGFINVHCHLELSHMKGHIPKHTGLVDFVLKVVNDRHFSTEEILTGIEKAENEMLQNGIVAVGDICNNTLSIPQKRRSRLQYHNFIEASGFIPAVANTRFEQSRLILEEYQGAVPGQRSTLSPHAPYSVSPELFALINELPGNHLLTIHNQEASAENEFFENGTGNMLRMYRQMGIDISFFKPSRRSSLQTWLSNFTKDQSIILVHNVHTSAADLLFLKFQASNGKPGYRTGRLQTFLCLCPNANLYIGNTLPDVNLLMQHTDDIVLGTDSLASNDGLSILAEIKTLKQNFKIIDLAVFLKWATINGAKALQVDDKLGSFETGKQPGVILIDGTGLEKVKRMI